MLESYSTAYRGSAGAFTAELIVCALLYRSGIPKQDDNRLAAAAPCAFLDCLERYGDRARIRPQDACGLLDLASFIGSPRIGTLVHACGPEPPLGAAQESCVGWIAGTQDIERFAQVRPTAEAAPAGAFDVVLARSGCTPPVPPNRSVLEVVKEAGVPVLFSCREGICGTYETDVLDGTSDHRDSTLDEDERASDNTMLICVSRSCDPLLVLDI
ncbi:iron-sulfur cluster-binding domain-containing protein [Streptomyces sp. ME18-1-4]|uniref:flavin reductase family protein n=1 Tax=Streptomyces sp. ME18-1-4 TaxID=3028685 RepID=UPI0029CA32D6|nr:iron-sulfur cluster-binding domain-containing protein [Streptomyces sp. ME18-1-4]